MINYFAGKYFVQEGLMNTEKLDEIMARQEVVSANFSKIEKEASSFLEDNQIALIKMMQNTIDEKLGDLAFEYEQANEEQFKLTIRKQQILNTAFFDQLIVEGIITPDTISHKLEKMRNYYALNSPGVSHNLKHDFDIILATYVNTADHYINEYMNIALKYILRFVGANIALDKAKPAKSVLAQRAAVQKVVTDSSRYFLGICGEKLDLQSFSDGLEHTFSSNRKASRYSALCSFLDCISNVFQCLIMKEKNVLLVDTPNAYKFATITADEYIYTLPLTVRDMSFEIIAGVGDKPNFAVISHNI